MYKSVVKPCFDFLTAFIGCIVLLPVFLVLALAVKIDSKGPVLFKQKRVGKNKKLFNIYKFRTMRIDTPHDRPTHLLDNPEQYITKVGGFLRKTSLDELPQIFNILFGQMSVVGPRPALYNQDDLVAARDGYGANGVRPGLTGWAQVNGRDELEISDKAALDGEYVQKMSFRMDVKIFFLTVKQVFRSEGVVEGGTGALRAEEESAQTEKPDQDVAEAEKAEIAAEEAAATADQPACDPIVLDNKGKERDSEGAESDQ